jgi:hypothetical protein
VSLCVFVRPSFGISSISLKTVKDNFCNVLFWKNKAKAVIHDCVSLDILNVKADELREQYSISADKKLIGNVANHTDAKDTFINVVDYLVNFK